MRPISEGASISWEIRDDTLYLQGSGPMEYGYDSEKERLSIPWYYEDFSKVVFDGNITTIGPETFHTSDLTEIVIPDSVEKICELAFCSCKSLRSVTIGPKTTEIGTYAFADCCNLGSITLGENIETIRYDAFNGCSSLGKVDLPSGLKTLGDRAFGNCTSLGSVRIGESVTEIDGNPFIGCRSLERIEISPENPAFSSRNGCMFDKDGTVLRSVPGGRKDGISFDDTVRIIAHDAFNGSVIESVDLPKSLLFMAPGAFTNCFRLKTVRFDRDCGLQCIPTDAFSECTALENVTLPDSLEEIGEKAFSDCGHLHGIVFPESLVTIGDSAFGNSGLRSVSFPDSLVTIGEKAFFANKALRKISFGNGPLSIGREAFLYCTSVEELDIPDSVLDIGHDAFGGCESLKKVTLHTTGSDRNDFLPDNPGMTVEYDSRDGEYNTLAP